jgi:hypothetical protein
LRTEAGAGGRCVSGIWAPPGYGWYMVLLLPV